MNIETDQKSIDNSVEPIDPNSVHQLRLSTGRTMPAAAFGTFHSDWAQEQMKDATVEAIRLGWRHIDTARAYENEKLIGAAISQSVKDGHISSANDLYITGKLWNGHMSSADVAPALHTTLKSLGVDQIDMYINHWPWPNVHTPGCATDHRNPDAVPYIHEQFMETWGEICKLKKAGKIVDIGTSNHTRANMELLLRDVAKDERPVYNQMEMHPLFQQQDLRGYFESEGIVCSGFMAVGSPNRPGRDRFKEHRADMNDPVIQSIATELGVSPGKVCLAWAVQRENKSGGFVAMTTRSRRMVENLSVACDDLLSQKQLSRIDDIDANNRLIWGQVFLWPEADGDWRLLWDDSQVFETLESYQKFKESWNTHHQMQKETTYGCQK